MRIWLLSVAALAASATPGVLHADPAERFVDSVVQDASLPADVRELVLKAFQSVEPEDRPDFLAQGLTVLSTPFRQLLEAYEGEEYEKCARLGGGLRTDGNPFVAAHAAAYEIKSFVALERLIDAGERLEEMYASDGAERIAAYSYFDAEMAFLRGYCLVSNLQYEAGAEALRAFLDRYPNASQRLSISARQMLTELANRVPGTMGEVVDLMNNSHSRLNQGDSGDVVQGRQKRIVELLDQMIEEAEQQEKMSQCNNPKGGSGGSPQPQEPKESQGSRPQQSQRQPESPAQESMLPGGTQSIGPLREVRKANPAEVWGAMPPTERERVLQALRDSFPSRYHQLVEQYYEELAKKP